MEPKIVESNASFEEWYASKRPTSTPIVIAAENSESDNKIVRLFHPEYSPGVRLYCPLYKKNYQECLDELKGQTVNIKDIYITNPNMELPDCFNITIRDSRLSEIEAKKKEIVVVPVIDPYQQTLNVVHVRKAFELNEYTVMFVRCPKFSTTVFYFYPDK